MRPRALLGLVLGVSACGGLNSSQGSDGMDDAPMEVSQLGTPPQASNPPAPQVDSNGEAVEQRPPRPTINSTPFRLADIPLASIPALPDESHAPRGLKGAPAPDLVIEPTSSEFADVRVKTPDDSVARLRIAGTESATWEGLRVKCGIHRRSASPARWEVLERPRNKRAARYTVVNAWFDASACTAVVIDRTTVELHPVIDRLLYAYRECDKSCDNHQMITFVGPALKQVAASAVGGVAATAVQPFGKVTMQLERGSGSSLSGRIDAQSLESWFGGKRPAWARGSDDVVLGVDVVQAVEEPEPVAVAYVGRTSPLLTSSEPQEPVDVDISE